MQIRSTIFILFSTTTGHWPVNSVNWQTFEEKVILSLKISARSPYRDCCIKNVTIIIFKGITDLINKKHYHDYVWAFNILPVFWICWIFKDLVFIFGPRSVFMKLGWWQMIYIKIHNICFKMFLVPFLID